MNSQTEKFLDAAKAAWARITETPEKRQRLAIGGAVAAATVTVATIVRLRSRARRATPTDTAAVAALPSATDRAVLTTSEESPPDRQLPSMKKPQEERQSRDALAVESAQRHDAVLAAPGAVQSADGQQSTLEESPHTAQSPLKGHTSSAVDASPLSTDSGGIHATDEDALPLQDDVTPERGQPSSGWVKSLLGSLSVHHPADLCVVAETMHFPIGLVRMRSTAFEGDFVLISEDLGATFGEGTCQKFKARCLEALVAKVAASDPRAVKVLRDEMHCASGAMEWQSIIALESLHGPVAIASFYAVHNNTGYILQCEAPAASFDAALEVLVQLVRTTAFEDEEESGALSGNMRCTFADDSGECSSVALPLDFCAVDETTSSKGRLFRVHSRRNPRAVVQVLRAPPRSTAMGPSDSVVELHRGALYLHAVEEVRPSVVRSCAESFTHGVPPGAPLRYHSNALSFDLPSTASGGCVATAFVVEHNVGDALVTLCVGCSDGTTSEMTIGIAPSRDVAVGDVVRSIIGGGRNPRVSQEAGWVRGDMGDESSALRIAIFGKHVGDNSSIVLVRWVLQPQNAAAMERVVRGTLESFSCHFR